MCVCVTGLQVLREGKPGPREERAETETSSIRASRLELKPVYGLMEPRTISPKPGLPPYRAGNDNPVQASTASSQEGCCAASFHLRREAYIREKPHRADMPLRKLGQCPHSQQGAAVGGRGKRLPGTHKFRP